jgi:hypothetical protein
MKIVERIEESEEVFKGRQFEEFMKTSFGDRGKVYNVFFWEAGHMVCFFRNYF